MSWGISCIQKLASPSIFSGLDYTLSHHFSISSSLCPVHVKLRCQTQWYKCHSWSRSTPRAGTRPSTAVALSIAMYKPPFENCHWSLGMIIYVLWNSPPLEINFLPTGPGRPLALNWCVFTKAFEEAILHGVKQFYWKIWNLGRTIMYSFLLLASFTRKKQKPVGKSWMFFCEKTTWELPVSRKRKQEIQESVLPFSPPL